MQTTRCAGALVLALLLAGCPGERRVEADGAMVADTPLITQDVPSPAEPMAPAPQTVQLEQVGGSGVTGEATFSERDGQTVVLLTVRGASADATLPAHIHSGRCDAPGGVVAPLESVATGPTGAGQSESTIDVSLHAIMDGQHLVQVHDPAPPVACGDLPAHAM